MDDVVGEVPLDLAEDIRNLRIAFANLKCEVAWLRFERAARRFAFKAGFDPDQPRIPRGQPGGGRWTDADGHGGGALSMGDGATPIVLAQSRPRSGTTARSGRMVFTGTPAQLTELEVARLESQSALNAVRRWDPTYRPTPSLSVPDPANIRGEIAYHRGIAAEARAYLDAILAADLRGPPELVPLPRYTERWQPLRPGSEVLQRPLPGEIPLLPMGFRSQAGYASFVRSAYDQLSALGYPNALIGIRGSAATGFRYRTGRAFNDSSTKPSDIDLGIISRELYERIAVIAPGRINRKQGRTDQLKSRGKLTYDLGIADIILRARLETGQPASIVVYRDLQTYIRRGPFVPVE